jgi:hypothetical protein
LLSSRDELDGVTEAAREAATLGMRFVPGVDSEAALKSLCMRAVA